MVINSKLVWKVFSAILFIVVSGLVLFFAYGYRFDFKKNIIQQTSIIDIKSRISDVVLSVDGNDSQTSLPFQVKNILPGTHRIKIAKAGFSTFERVLQVNVDKVSIIEQVILVPQLISKYTKPVYELPAEKTVYYGDHYLLALQPGQNEMGIVVMDEAGKVKEDEMQFFKPVSEVISLFPGEKFILRFDDNLYGYVDFPGKYFKLITSPVGEVSKLLVDKKRGLVFLLSGQQLLRIEMDTLFNDNQPDFSRMSIASGVQDFVIDGTGWVYYLKNGLMWRVNYDGSEDGLLEDNGMRYKNIAVYGDSVRMFILRTVDDERLLLVQSDENKFDIVSTDLKGKPLLSENGMMVFGENDGNIFSYSRYGREKTLLINLQNEFVLDGWMAGDSYFVFRNQDKMQIMDVYGEEPMLMGEGIGADLKVFVNDEAIYYEKEAKLNAIHFMDALEN